MGDSPNAQAPTGIRPDEPQASKPAGPRDPMPLPRGIEVLLKKASVDPEFRRQLLAERAAAAVKLGLELTPQERALIEDIPAEQLDAIIDRTKVAPEHVPVFRGWVVALMLAAVGVAAAAVFLRGTTYSAGVRPADDIHPDVPGAVQSQSRPADSPAPK